MKPLSEVVPGFGHSDPNPSSVNKFRVEVLHSGSYLGRVIGKVIVFDFQDKNK